MTLLDTNIALRDAYLADRGLVAQDFGLNYLYPILPSTNWDWYKAHKFGTGKLFRRAGFFLIYLNVEGEPYLQDEVPYGVVRFLGAPTGVPEGEKPPKVLAQWGRRSEIHFEPINDGRSWESLAHGTKVIHCESLIKAKVVHKYTGLPCIGYNGVHGYSSAKQGVELIHEFAGFAFDKMDNVILYDSDVWTNEAVQAARAGLAHKLRHIMNCPLVSFASLPRREADNGSGELSNWGPDDYLMTFGPEALLKVIEGAEPYVDEEYSALVAAMNEKVKWVKDQSGVYDRDGRRLLKWADATLSYRNVNREVVKGKMKQTVYGTDVWIKSIYREEVDSMGYRYMGPEVFERGGLRIANEYLPDGATVGGRDEAGSGLGGGIVLDMLERLFKPTDLELMRSYLKFLKFSAEKPTSYCVMWSGLRGVGKGWFTELARRLIGRRHVATSTADQLAEKYNLHTVNCRLLIVHEFKASNGSNKKAALNYLKSYVGDEVMPVRAMARNVYSAEVRAGLIITTNDKTDMPSDGLGDRRQWYIEAGAGMREGPAAERGAQLWGPEAEEWRTVWEALADEDTMAAVARWVWEGVDVDFRSWRPELTEERVEDLMEGMGTLTRVARDVLIDAREAGVTVMDAKAIRTLMVEKMDGAEIGLYGAALGKCLKEAGWWTDKIYARATASKSAAWFTDSFAGDGNPLPSAVPGLIKADAIKMYRKF